MWGRLVGYSPVVLALLLAIRAKYFTVSSVPWWGGGGAAGDQAAVLFLFFGVFFGLNNRNYFWTLWRWEVQDQGAGQVGFILRPLLMACRWPPPCYMLT